MVCTGAKSEEESKTAAKQYSKQIKKTLDNKAVKMKEFKI
jgi:TATA-box binding protein (TBP) (component of TFIID and TFIIIB)